MTRPTSRSTRVCACLGLATSFLWTSPALGAPENTGDSAYVSMNGSTVRVSGLWLTEVGLKPARAAIKSRATSGKSGVKSIRGTKTPKARYTRVVKVL